MKHNKFVMNSRVLTCTSYGINLKKFPNFYNDSLSIQCCTLVPWITTKQVNKQKVVVVEIKQKI